MKILHGRILAVVLVAGLFSGLVHTPASARVASAPQAQVSSQAYTWKNVEIGGGGFVPGIIFNTTQRDLVYARTDIGGAYRLDPATRRWIPLTDFISDADYNLLGIESLATDPVDTNRVYIATGAYLQSFAGNGAIFRSTDRGASWLRTDMPFKMGGNEPGRSIGERLMVDPNRNSILFFGTRNDGLWKSTDFGATWARVTSFPVTGQSNLGIGWVTFDPRTWNADMDCTVNTGLGAGTRERDMLMMQVVTGMQEKLLAAFGPSNNLYVKPEQLYNGIAKTVEASGLKSVDQYFSNPTPEEVQAYAQAKAQQPSPEQEKTQGALQIEQAKGQTQLALADKKMQVEANKEREQRDADIVIKQAELEKETQKAMHEAQIKSAAEAEKMQIEREKIASQERMKLAEIEANIMLERERMDREDARAERQHQADAENRQLEQSVQ